MSTIKTEYLLPCPCGQKLVVDRSQAGLSVRCDDCGADVAIPTLRGLDRLERAEPGETVVASEWGARQALLFLGSLIAGAALVAAGILWMARPIFDQEYHDALIDAAGSTADLDQMTLSQTFEVWKEMQQPPEMPNIPEYRNLINNHQAAVMAYRRRMGISLTVALFGAIVLGTSLLVPQRKPAAG